MHFWRNPGHDSNDNFIEIFVKSQILFQIFYTKLSSISSGWNRQRSLSDEHVKTFCAFGAVVPLWRYFWSNMVVATPKPLVPERTQKDFLWQLLRYYNTCWDWMCENKFHFFKWSDQRQKMKSCEVRYGSPLMCLFLPGWCCCKIIIALRWLFLLLWFGFCC